MLSAHGQKLNHSEQKPTKQASQVKSRLVATGYSPLQNVYCETDEDVLILSGVVPSYYMKQVAQTVAGKLEGVEHIDNQLEVRSPR